MSDHDQRPMPKPHPLMEALANRRDRWGELDFLRGLAAILMVANHTAVRLTWSSTSSVVEAGAFVGSFAPVVFFLITGLGSGVQSVQARPNGWPVRRCGLLLVADALLWLGPCRYAGLDFLGFIALSTIGLHALQRLHNSGRLAILLVAALVLVRFGIGPLCRHTLPDDTGWGSFVALCTGTGTIPGFSYPPAPWLTYPLIGFALGRLATRRAEWRDRHATPVVCVSLTIGILFLVAASALASRGAVVFRWGSVSLAFYLASLGVVGLALATAAGAPVRWGAVVAISSIRSLAVVPLHYLFIAAAGAALGPARSPLYVPFVLLLTAVCFAGSVVVSWAVNLLMRVQTAAGLVAAGVTVASLIAIATTTLAPLADAAVRGIGQLAVCVLLAIGSPSRRVPS